MNTHSLPQDSNTDVHSAVSACGAFTLIELAVVVAIVGVLASLLTAALNKAQATVRRGVCVANLRQINLATHLYADDHDDFIPYSKGLSFDYKERIQTYLSQPKGSSAADKVFACPSDDFDLSGKLSDWFLQEPGSQSFHRQSWTHYSSYAFNSGARGPKADFGMAQRVFGSVREPTRTVLVGEISGFAGLSTHDRKAPLQFADAQNVMSFVDGHVSYIRIHWNGTSALEGFPFFHEPPPSYEYKWSGF